MDLVTPLKRCFFRFQAVWMFFIHQRAHGYGQCLQMMPVSPFLDLVARYATPENLAVENPAGLELFKNLRRLLNSQVLTKSPDKRGLSRLWVRKPLRNIFKIHRTS